MKFSINKYVKLIEKVIEFKRVGMNINDIQKELILYDELDIINEVYISC